MSQLATSTLGNSFVTNHSHSTGAVDEQSYAIATLDGEIALDAGLVSTDARHFLSFHRIERFAVLSAANPHGISLSAHANRQRHELLRSTLVEQGYRVFEASAVDFDARYPALLVSGIALEDARDLARCFAQGHFLAGNQRSTAPVACDGLDFSI